MADDSLRRLLTPRALLGGFVVCILFALVIAIITSTAPFGPYNPNWDGSSTLRDTVDTDPSAPPVIVDTTAYARFPGDDTLVIIAAPQESYTAAEIGRLRAFLDRGGTLLIAEDRRTATNQLLEQLGASARVDGRPLRDPQTFYRDPSLPVVTDLNNTSLTREVGSITLNGGTVVQPGNATTIARTSEFAYIDRNENQQLDANEPLQPYPVLSSEPVGEGRVVLLSDPSVFINQMLEREGNQQFVTQMATSYDHVVVDFSHRPGVPPAAVFWLWLRRTPWAQALLGVLGAGGIVLGVSEQVRSRLRDITIPVLGDELPTVESVILDTDDVTQLLQRQYPEWEAERVERIAENMNQLDHTQSVETDE